MAEAFREDAFIEALMIPQRPRPDLPCMSNGEHGFGTDEDCWACKEWLRGNIVPPEETRKQTQRRFKRLQRQFRYG